LVGTLGTALGVYVTTNRTRLLPDGLPRRRRQVVDPDCENDADRRRRRVDESPEL